GDLVFACFKENAFKRFDQESGKQADQADLAGDSRCLKKQQKIK
ncbi:MAG: hypothetical protein UV46_C0005G0021, partial [Candidatus Gottesmanbacteria bacterium GW2011_GWC2_42_8]